MPTTQKDSGIFYLPPLQLKEAQAWLIGNGISRAHCATLCNIHNRWKHQPNKPLSLSDIDRLYGITRKTAKRLLDVLAAKCGYTLERSRRRSGADEGYLMRQANTAGVDEARTTTEHSTPCWPSGPEGVSPQGQGVSPLPQGGESCAPPSKNNIKNTMKEKELSSQRCRAELHRLDWEEGGRMFDAALEVFEGCQARLGGEWELEEDDRQQLLHAAQRIEAAFQRGECVEGIETRLANALDRAEAYSWSHYRRFPHNAAKHFGVHLRADPLEPVQIWDRDTAEGNCHQESIPAVEWCHEEGCWQATNHEYSGELFPVVGVW